MLKKSLTAITMLAFALPGLVLGQTTSLQDRQAIIARLQEQIKALQVQVTALTKQLEAQNKEIENVKTELAFTQTLQRGMTGDEVKKLQEFLKQFPEVYPEGLVTGYYGSLTEAAVKKLQEKQGIEAVGIVGPKTLAKLNELVTTGAGQSGVIPPGLLAAPGIEKLEVPLATTTIITATTSTQVVPPTPTSTPSVASTTPAATTTTIATPPPSYSTPSPPPPPPPPSPSPTPPPSTSSDTAAPSVPTNLITYAVSTSEIRLSWESSTDNIGVAGYTIYRNGTQITTVAVASPPSYSYLLYYSDTGLQTSATPYVYTVTAYDTAGNTSAQSASASAITQLPPIRIISPNGGENWEYEGQGIYYKLNGVSRIGFTLFKGSQVIYTTGSPITDTAQTTYSLNRLNSSVVGSGSDYKIRVYNWDNPEVYDDSDSYFTILPGDFAPPVVSSVSASSITANSAVITWTTDEPASGYVNYGSTLSGPSADWTITPQDTSSGSYVTSHSATLSNLKSGTLYIYRVYASDAKGNAIQGYPPEHTFTTTGTATASTATTTSLKTRKENLAAIGDALESLKVIVEQLLKLLQ